MIRLLLKPTNINTCLKRLNIKRLITSSTTTNTINKNNNNSTPSKSTKIQPISYNNNLINNISKNERIINKLELECNVEEIKEICGILKSQIDDDQVCARDCFETFEKLPYKSDFIYSELYLVYFKKIIEKGIQNNETEALFIFFKERIHYFDRFIHSEKFQKLMELFLKFDHKPEKLLLNYYNNPFRNILVELFKFHMLDDSATFRIFRLILSYGDLSSFDFVFDLYKKNQNIIKSMDNNNNTQIDQIQQNIYINTKKSQTNISTGSSNGSSGSDGNGVGTSFGKFEKLNLNGFNFGMAGDGIHFYLVQRAILNGEYDTVVTILDNGFKNEDISMVNCFQIILETCYHLKEPVNRYIDILFKKEYHQKKVYKLFPLLLYYNQFKSNRLIFNWLSNYLLHSVKPMVKSEIYSTMIPICLTLGRYELALIWYSHVMSISNQFPTAYLSYALAYYHTQNDSSRTIIDHWIQRLDIQSIGNESYYRNNAAEIKEMLKNDFESLSKYKGYVKSIDLSLRSHFELFKNESIHYKRILDEPVTSSVYPPSSYSYGNIISDYYNKIKRNGIDNSYQSSTSTSSSSSSFSPLNSLNLEDESNFNFNDELICVTLMPNSKKKLYLTTDKYLAFLLDKCKDEQGAEKLKDQILSRFAKNKTIPNDLLIRSAYRIRKYVDIYYQFIDGMPSFYSLALFDFSFASYLLAKDFDQGIALIAKQDPLIIKSPHVQISIVRSLLTIKKSSNPNAVELANQMMKKMFSIGIDLDNVGDLLGHLGRFGDFVIPNDIYQHLHGKMKFKRITALHLYNLAKQGLINEAYEYYKSCPKELIGIDSLKTVLELIYPVLYPLSNLSNIDNWFNILRENPEEHVRSKLGFFDHFFENLELSGNGNIALEIAFKDKVIFCNIKQMSILNILNRLLINDSNNNNNNNSSTTTTPSIETCQLIIDIFKSAQQFDFYHQDLINIIKNANQVINDPEVTQKILISKVVVIDNNNDSSKTSSPTSSSTTQQKYYKPTLNEYSINFIKSNYIN